MYRPWSGKGASGSGGNSSGDTCSRYGGTFLPVQSHNYNTNTNTNSYSNTNTNANANTNTNTNTTRIQREIALVTNVTDTAALFSPLGDRAV